MKREYGWMLAIAFMFGYIVGMQFNSGRTSNTIAIQTTTPQITYIVEEPLTIERAIEEYEQSLTATVTPLPDNMRIITATPMPTTTPRPVIVNGGVTVW